MTEPSNHGFLEDLGADLAKTLGEAIWAFAKIEWLTYEYIDAFGGEDLLSLVGDQSFHARLRILRKLVERHPGPEDPKSSALESLRVAEELAKSRNTIVHNPWQVYFHLNERELVTKIYKRSNPKHQIDLADVKKFTTESEETYRALETSLEVLADREREGGFTRGLRRSLSA